MASTRSKPKRDLATVVQEMCLAMPGAEEVISHGSPDYRVGKKSFANYHLNHHGDGRVALWLNSPSGAQDYYTRSDPDCYFVPPYVGPKGWLGVELNQGLPWRVVAERICDAYNKVVPKSRTFAHADIPDVKPPSRLPTAAEIDPFVGADVKRVLGKLDKLLERLPELGHGAQFGSPTWTAGKKSFLAAYHHHDRLQLSFWVGIDEQPMLTLDKRFHIPAYTGHNGWIVLDIEDQQDWSEIEQLAEQSYRHFALKRMLRALDSQFE